MAWLVPNSSSAPRQLWIGDKLKELLCLFSLLLLHLFLFHAIISWAGTPWAFACQTLSPIEALIYHTLAVYLQHKTQNGFLLL